jgi:hypothetical protein
MADFWTIRNRSLTVTAPIRAATVRERFLHKRAFSSGHGTGTVQPPVRRQYTNTPTNTTGRKETKTWHWSSRAVDQTVKPHGNMNREDVIATLRGHESELRAAGVIRLSLFGSTARGDYRADSDIDVLAAFDDNRANFRLTDDPTLKKGMPPELCCIP